jgi:hypothetical protein
MEVEGKMPDDKQQCLDIINDYLSLPDEERLNFKVGRRAGLYNRLADMSDSHRYDEIAQAVQHLTAEGRDAEEAITRLKNTFI